MERHKAYWFPAKTYGWGWGFPNTWQGWAVLAAHLAGVVAAVIFVPPKGQPIAFCIVLGVLTAMLLVVCWLKGEPPKWRWGRR